MCLNAEVLNREIVYLAIGDDVQGYNEHLPPLDMNNLEGARVIDLKNGIDDDVSLRLKGFNLGARIPFFHTKYVTYLGKF